MKNKNIIFPLALLFAALFFSNSMAQNARVKNGPGDKTQHSVNLTVFEIETDHKTIVCGDGVSPLYWRFRIPDSKWEAVEQKFKADVPAEIGYIGYDLSDPRSLASDDDYSDVAVVNSLVFYLPEKVF